MVRVKKKRNREQKFSTTLSFRSPTRLCAIYIFTSLDAVTYAFSLAHSHTRSLCVSLFSCLVLTLYHVVCTGVFIFLSPRLRFKVYAESLVLQKESLTIGSGAVVVVICYGLLKFLPYFWLIDGLP